MTEADLPATRRVIGRILSLGFPLAGPQVDNYTVISAPSFFDYDAVVIDPHAASLLIEEVIAGTTEARTFTDAVVRNGQSSATDVALADVLLRRRDETQRLLDHGGVVIVFAHPGVTHPGIEGTDAIDDYWWLPLPDGVAIRTPLLVAGEGTQAHVIDYQHPLAAFIDSQLANVAYRAYFDERTSAGMSVFARSEGGAAIGVELPSKCGRIIFLPAMRTIPAGDARYAMSDALQSGIRRALGVLAAGRPPYWLAQHPLPGIEARATALTEAQAALDAAVRAADDDAAAYENLAKYQRLLWQEGSVGLDGVVLDALRRLGCDVYATDHNALEITAAGVGALIEIEASEHAVEMAPHHRLRQRIERGIEKRGAAPRGIIFVNGRRLEEPSSRAAQVTDSLRIAAETLRYCVAPTSTLYAAVVAKLNGDDEAVATYLRSLTSTDGVLA